MTSPAAHMTIQERARFAIEHRDVAHTPDDLREIIAGLLNGQVRLPMVRYCHECGTVGEPMHPGHCCPDGSHATYVHPEVADQARMGFLSLIEKERVAEHAEERTHL